MSKDSSLAECRCNQRPVETKKLYTCDSTVIPILDSYSPVHLCSATHIRVANCCIWVCRDFTLVSPCNIRAQPALEKVSLSEKVKGLGAIFDTWCFLMERFVRVVWLQFRLKRVSALAAPSNNEIDSWLSSQCRRLLPSVHGAETTSAAAHGRGPCHLWTSSFVEFDEHKNRTDTVVALVCSSHLANCVCGYLNFMWTRVVDAA